MERSNPSMRPHRRSFRFSTLALALALCLAVTASAGAQTSITKTYRVTGYTTGNGWSWQLNFTNPVGMPSVNSVGGQAGTTLAAGTGQALIASEFASSIGSALAGVTQSVSAQWLGGREFSITSSTSGADERDFYLLVGLSSNAPRAKVSTTGAHLGTQATPGFLVRRIIDPATVLKAPSVLREGVNAPLPIGGQKNGLGAFLTQSIPPNPYLYGPLEYWGAGGANVTLTHGGAANMPIILLIGKPDTGWAQVPNLGSVDLDITQPIFEVYNGLLNPLIVSGLTINYSLPTGLTAMFASVQGLTIDGSAPLGFYLTARNDVGIQDTTSINGTPEMPPFIVNAPQPISPALTSTYAYPRDGIVPNNGPVSTNQGAFDGTLHSAIGANFDATVLNSTTAAVNGVAVDVWHVRPDELIFSLLQTHVSTIGGPLVITTTGGTYTPPADATESWVWATPVNFGLEGPGVGAPSVSGTFNANIPSPGQMQGFIGWKDSAGQVDYYDITGLTAPLLSVYAGEYDDTNFTSQFVSQCSGLPSTPAATCYTETTEPFSQQWFAPNSLQDTWLHQGLGNPGMPFIGTFVMDQDDGGPGVCSFAGMSGIPGSATQPTLDPDAAWTPTGMDFIVVEDFPNPTGGAFPYKYVVLCIY